MPGCFWQIICKHFVPCESVYKNKADKKTEVKKGQMTIYLKTEVKS